MSSSASVSIRTSVAGIIISQAIERTGGLGTYGIIPLPSGKAGSVLSQADINTGVISVAAGHGFTTDDIPALFWDGDSSMGGTVTAVGSTTIEVDNISLPVAETPVVISKRVVTACDIDGSKLAVLALKSARRSRVDFRTIASSLISYDMPDEEGRFYFSDMGMSSVFTSFNGSTVKIIAAANGTTYDTNLEIATYLNAVCKQGILASKTDGDTGYVTVAAGHGFAVGDVAYIFWDGGLCVLNITEVTSNSIKVDGGIGGSSLPSPTATVFVMKQVA